VLTVLYILARVVQILLGAIELAMFLQVILQFFVDRDNKLYMLCVFVSEPFVLPFRALFAKLNLWQDVPLDMPFLFAYITISLVSVLLPLI